jgi:hypothetical protein
MNPSVRPTEQWAAHNAKQDARLERWGPLNKDEQVKCVHFIKYGLVRWEAQLNEQWYPHLIWYYRTKGEAIAKGVELVLKGYAGKVIDE